MNAAYFAFLVFQNRDTRLVHDGIINNILKCEYYVKIKQGQGHE